MNKNLKKDPRTLCIFGTERRPCLMVVVLKVSVTVTKLKSLRRWNDIVSYEFIWIHNGMRL